MNQFTLSNGVKVLHKEINQNPLVTMQVFLHGGSINEKPDQAGLANFTQVVMMQGTTRRDSEALATEIEDIGGISLFDIEPDFCTLGMSVMTANEDKAADLLADIIFNPSFLEPEIEKERANILASIKSRQDHIFQTADDIFLKAFYDNHPYSWPDIGRAETVSKFTRNDLVTWHKDHYVPNDMLLVIAGDIKLDKAKALSEKYFAGQPKGELHVTFPKPVPPKPQQITKNSRKFQQAYLMLGFPVPSIDDPDFSTLKVLNSLLGGRMSGRLFTELREKLSLAYEVSSFYTTRREMSRFTVYMGLEKSNLELAKKRIGEILEELKTVPVSEKELNETKTFIRGVYLLDHQSVGRQVWYTGWWEIMGRGYAYDDKYVDDLMKVTSADLQKAAQKYFTAGCVQVEIIPER